MPAVDWRGFVSEEEKRTILRESRLLLAPSSEEGWGIAVAEALAAGVPVVAYTLPVLDELFGSAYVGTPVGDIDTLAARAVEVLTDDALATRLSRAGREAVARYDVAATHGAGCTHSATLAAGLAKGLALDMAAREAARVASEAVRNGYAELGAGDGPVNVAA